MNVAEIRQRIFDQMDYFPDLQQYRDSVVRRLNDRYQELCDSAHWLYLQKEVKLKLRKQITGTDSSVAIKVLSTNKRRVESNFSLTIEMEGQILTNTTTGKEFRIVRVESGTIFFIDDDWDGTLGSEVYNWKVTFQRFPLPDDCVEVLSYTDREADRGKLLFVSRRREEHAYLDADNTGDPTAVVEDEHILDEPPVNSLTASSTSFTVPVLAVLPAGTYEYKYTIYREGRESPPSLTVKHVHTVASGASGGIVNLSGLDNTGFLASAGTNTFLESGMDKLIYRRDVGNDGKWMLIGTVPSNVTTFTDDRLFPNQSFQYLNESTFRYSNTTDVLRWTDSGPVQYVRFWYTPSEDKSIHLRYHYRPRDLIADNDAPVIPRQYHTILVYMTLQDMFLQMQDTVQSQLFERRALQLLTQLRRRYLARDDDRKRMQRWDRPRRFRNVYGTPTIGSN
tara:strand:+ start:2816 stop:4168 length:1353 start_codon:yes stop_codon:yes gene_type:complete